MFLFPICYYIVTIFTRNDVYLCISHVSSSIENITNIRYIKYIRYIKTIRTIKYIKSIINNLYKKVFYFFNSIL